MYVTYLVATLTAFLRKPKALKSSAAAKSLINA
jgi:hypothetical protein